MSVFVELSAPPPIDAPGPTAQLVAARSAETESAAEILTLDLTPEQIDELSEYAWVRVIRMARPLRYRSVDPG